MPICAGHHSAPARLDHSVLRGANLTGADFAGASLINASLTGADLSDTDLTGTMARGADLRDTTLTNTRFIGAVLTELRFSPAFWEGLVIYNMPISFSDGEWRISFVNGPVVRKARPGPASLNRDAPRAEGSRPPANEPDPMKAEPAASTINIEERT